MSLGSRASVKVGACAAPSAVVIAAIDALKHLGVTALDMPMTPERIWRVINSAMT